MIRVPSFVPPLFANWAKAWAAAAEDATTPDVHGAGTEYGNMVVQVLREVIGVTERSRNRGPMVDTIIRGGGGNPVTRAPWCARTVAWAHHEAAGRLGVTTNCPKDGGAVRMLLLAASAGVEIYTPDQVLAGEVTPYPGDYVCMLRPKDYRTRAADRIRRGVELIQAGELPRASWDRYLRSGHAETVEAYISGQTTMTQIGGNTSPGGGTEGRRAEGVWRHSRPIAMNKIVAYARFGPAG